MDPWHWLWEDGGYMLLEDDTGHWILEDSPFTEHAAQAFPTAGFRPPVIVRKVRRRKHTPVGETEPQEPPPPAIAVTPEEAAAAEAARRETVRRLMIEAISAVERRIEVARLRRIMAEIDDEEALIALMIA